MTLLRSIVTGYILLFYSERLFWTTFRPGDTLGDYVMTWLAYSVAAYLLLCIISVFRVAHTPAMMVAGAMYGWLVEGGIAGTLYGTEASAPFPLSLLCTGVSWHALISVLVGWHVALKLLGRVSPWPTLSLAAGIGLFWGLWAPFLWAETPPEITPLPRFLAHAAVTTALLALSYWLTGRFARRPFRVTWLRLGLAVVLLGFFYVQLVITLGVRTLLLPALLLAAAAVLARYRASASPDAAPPPPPLARNCLVLLVAPLVATGVYALLLSSGLDCSPLRNTLWWATIAVGGAALLASVLVILIRKRLPEP